jgi:hypothetical protein
MDRCRDVGGVFTMVWHNTGLLDPLFRYAYFLMLDVFAGIDNYNWRTESLWGSP